MHSDVGHLLDGRDATTLWTHEKAEVPGQFRWGWARHSARGRRRQCGPARRAGLPVPGLFLDRRGPDRPDHGRPGTRLAQGTARLGGLRRADGLRFQRRRQPEVLLDSPYLLALLDRTGKPLWHGPGRVDFPVSPSEGNTGETTTCKHALVDIDGDGKFEIASAGYGDGVRVIDPRTGSGSGRCAAPAPTGPKVAAANIDGRGGDEILYPAGNTLVVITGDRTSGRVLWTWQGPAALSMPAIADVDGDGLAEIVVQDALGTVHCLSQPLPNE